MSEQESHAALLNQGREQKRDGRLDDAIESFARAVEVKIAALDTEISACLAEYLMEYADALLLKEEASSTDFLRSLGNPTATADSEDDEGVSARLDSGRLDQPVFQQGGEEEEDLSDLQLAWESFEHARLCMLESDDSDVKFKGLSFVHCRLGDIQALQEQFPSSIADYGESIEYATKGNESARKVAGLIVSLCQTIQVFITTDECRQLDSEALKEIESKFRTVFANVNSKYISLHQDADQSSTSANSAALVARDGFLLAHALLSTVEDSTEIKSTMDELFACAKDCLDTRPHPGPVPGVTSSGFAVPSNQNNGEVVVVAVKRKLRDSVDGTATVEPAAKSSKSSEESSEELARADKAKLVD